MNQRDVFDTGAQRDAGADKPRPELIEFDFLNSVGQRVRQHVAGTSLLPQPPDVLRYTLTTPPRDLDYAKIAAVIVVHSTAYDLDTAYMNGARGLSIIPYDIIARVGRVLGHGAQHYGERNWQLGMPIDRTRQSLIRHMWGWQRELYFDEPDVVDEDDHTAATFINCMFLYYFVNEFKPTT